MDFIIIARKYEIILLPQNDKARHWMWTRTGNRDVHTVGRDYLEDWIESCNKAEFTYELV